MKELRLLTTEDLESAVKSINKRHTRLLFGVRVCLFGVLLAFAWYLNRELTDCEIRCGVLQANNEALKSDLATTKKSFEATKSLMRASFNGKRMSSPIHIQGDMLVSFIGEVN
jgi:hypothetical protein